jgi:hypothetical protein
MAHAFTPPPRRPLTRLPPFQYLLLSLFALLVLQPYMLHGRMGYLLFFASECALLVTGVLAVTKLFDRCQYSGTTPGYVRRTPPTMVPNLSSGGAAIAMPTQRRSPDF